MILERFGLALNPCQHSREQIRLTLEAVRDSLGADAVYWYPGATSDPFEKTVAPPSSASSPTWQTALTAAWCREFTEEIVRQERMLGSPEGTNVAPASVSQVLRTFLDPGGALSQGAHRLPSLSGSAGPKIPISVAMVRVSKSRGSWLGALSFHPRRIFQRSDLEVMLLARRMLLNHRQQAQVYDKLRESLFGLVRCLTAAIDAKDPHTWGHSERVARIAVRLGKQMALPSAVLSDLYLAGLLHDMGKLGIRDNVLQKPGRLTAEEMKHIQEHPVIGDRLLSNLPQLAHLRPGVRHHHERFDGTGYPDALAGERIPLQARILAVADSCDAMMAARPYRPALPPHQIDAIMADGAGSQWDPQIITSFMACRQELYTICQRGLGESVFAAVERALDLGRTPMEDASRLAPPFGPLAHS